MKIVCLGDSVTYGFGVLRRDTWVALCSSAETECINKGVNGDTTGGMLARYSADVLPSQPDAVLLMGGANDRFFGGTFGAAKMNMTALCHRSVACGIRPVIGIPIPLCPPIREGWDELVEPTFYDDYGRYGDELSHIASVFSFDTVDFRTAFQATVDASGEPMSTFYLRDGMHPSANGHRVMADIFREALGKLL